MVALLPVFCTKVQAASTSHRPGREGLVAEIAWSRMYDWALLGCTPVAIDRIDVSGQNQAIGSDPLGQERAL